MLVITWIGALAWLVIREYRPVPEGQYTRSVETRLPPTTTFYALLAGSQQVGFRSITTDTLPDGLRVTSRIDVDVPLPLAARRLLITTEALYDQRLRLVGFTTTVSGEAGQQTLVASVQGDSTLDVVVSGRGQTRPDTVRLLLPQGVLLPDAVSIGLAAAGDLKPGAAASVPVLDPVELTISDWRIRVGAESLFVVADSAVNDSASGEWHPAGLDTVRAVRADWVEFGLPVRAWIDRRGAVLIRETPLGLTERRGPYEIVNSGYTRRRPRNVQAVPLEVGLPVVAPEPPARVTLGLTNLRTAMLTLSTPWQSVMVDALVSRPGPSVPAKARRPLPDSIAALLPITPPVPRLAIEARRAAGSDSASEQEAARRLAAWIANTIGAGQPTAGGPLQILLNRRGDSSDRAELFVAMAGALGIPARRVAGLLATAGRLRYRAWAEVWVGEWVPVDPTLGQLPADAGHFRLLVNATARPSTIVPMLGAIRPVLSPTATAP